MNNAAAAHGANAVLQMVPLVLTHQRNEQSLTTTNFKGRPYM